MILVIILVQGFYRHHDRARSPFLLDTRGRGSAGPGGGEEDPERLPGRGEVWPQHQQMRALLDLRRVPRRVHMSLLRRELGYVTTKMLKDVMLNDISSVESQKGAIIIAVQCIWQ